MHSPTHHTQNTHPTQNPPDPSKLIELSLAQLAQIRDQMVEQITQGLNVPNQAVKALPAFVRLPDKACSGEVVVLDAGGTNVRAARIDFSGDCVEFVAPSAHDGQLMSQAQVVNAIDATEFFQRQADLVQQVCAEPSFDLGYCFSYPSTNTPDGDARLVTWTKGINVADVVGTSLRQHILKALGRNHQIAHKIPVLNDTVTTLLASAWMSSCDRYIGLIAGTGLNAAAFYPVKHIHKLTPVERQGWADDDWMAVNLEIGNFHPVGLTAFDDALDALRIHDNPQHQRLEKAASGRYIPLIFGQVIGREACLNLVDGHAFDPEDVASHAGMVAQLRNYNDPMIANVARAIIDRSADLTATILAAIILGQNTQNNTHNTQNAPNRQITTGILIEGTLFWKTPGYQERVAQQLQQLIPEHIQPKFLHNDCDVQTNFIGAGYAALTQPDAD